MKNQIDWSKASLKDYTLAFKIVNRAKTELDDTLGNGLAMDLIATHVCGCKLKLQELLTADLGNFLHDVCGIMNHINRDNGELQDCFLPRYAV